MVYHRKFLGFPSLLKSTSTVQKGSERVENPNPARNSRAGMARRKDKGEKGKKQQTRECNAEWNKCTLYMSKSHRIKDKKKHHRKHNTTSTVDMCVCARCPHVLAPCCSRPTTFKRIKEHDTRQQLVKSNCNMGARLGQDRAEKKHTTNTKKKARSKRSILWKVERRA